MLTNMVALYRLVQKLILYYVWLAANTARNFIQWQEGKLHCDELLVAIHLVGEKGCFYLPRQNQNFWISKGIIIRPFY